jgi:hypothetical protein
MAEGECGTYNDTLTITDNATLVLLYDSIVQPSCASYQNGGSIYFEVQGGTAPYTYTWNHPVSNTNHATLLTADNYVITVTDANGCTLVLEYSINAPTQLNITSQLVQPTCGYANGSVYLNIEGVEVDAYQIAWSNQANSWLNDGLAAGTYSATITDENGCEYVHTETLSNEGGEINIQFTINHVSCFGENNGSITAFATGGVSPYTYEWGLSNSSTLSGLPAGNYSVLITDSLGCSATAIAEVSQPNNIVLNGTVTNVSCYEQEDGNINLTVSGGTQPFNYLWSNNAISNNISNLSAGTYVVYAIDANGCTATGTFEVTQPEQISFKEPILVHPSCFGSNDGSISVSFRNDFVPAMVVWSPTLNPNTLNQSNLSAGQYTIVAYDQNGCSASRTYELYNPIQLSVQLVNSSNNACASSKNGSLAVIGNGGVPAYSYLWNTGATSPNINSLSGGSYVVTVSDANGCTATGTYSISSPPSLVAFATADTNYVCDGATIPVTVSAVGGVMPYAGVGIFNAGVGTHFYTVTDSNGCTATTHISIESYEKADLSITQPIVCFGDSNAIIEVTAASHTAPLSYVWNNGNTNSWQSGLSDGWYSVTVTDGNGCTRTLQSYVTVTPPITVSPTVQNTICGNAASGSIFLSTSAYYFYSWSNGSTQREIKDLLPGVYTVTISDANGCSTINSYTVENGCPCPYNLTASICGPTTVCEGENFTLFANVFPRPQGFAYTYVWTDPMGNTYTTPNLNVNGAPVTMSGTYTLTVNFPPQCVATATYFVTVRPRPVANITNSITGTPNYLHMRGCDIQLTASGGVYYQWSVTPSTPITSNSSSIVFPTNTSTASQLNFRVFATDAYGCRSLQVSHPIRTANPNIARSLTPAGGNANTNRVLTFNQTANFDNATHLWTALNWSANGNMVSRPGKLAQLVGAYTLTLTQGSCSRQFTIELLPNGQFTSVTETPSNNGGNPKMMKPSPESSKKESVASIDKLVFKAYPNPTIDLLNIEIENPNEDFLSVMLMDVDGRVIRDLTLGFDKELKQQLDVSFLKSGVYFLKYATNGVVQESNYKIAKAD